MEAPTAKFIAGQKPCDLVVIETNIDEVHYAFAVQQGDEELKKKVVLSVIVILYLLFCHIISIFDSLRYLFNFRVGF